jgi:hypothetical protein
MDLSETQDLSALVLVGNLDGRTLIFPKFYLPKDNIVSKSYKLLQNCREELHHLGKFHASYISLLINIIN